MALARVKNWTAEVLTYSDLNAEFNSILNNVSSLITPITFNLTFTDATYDIGASGATRPRDLYLSRNAVIGGTLGVTGVATLTAIPVLTGGAIHFPATQVASADANDLDDYEEGSWTPAIGGSATYTAQTGTYTKIGRLVFCRGVLTINSVGTGDVDDVSGLPFTVSGASSGSISYFSTLATNAVYLGLNVVTGGTTFKVYSLGAAAASIANNAVFGNSTSIEFALTYQV